MDPKRTLIIGANGQLGKALMAKYPEATGADRDTLDITDVKALRSFDWSRFDTVINTAAFTQVDDAEAPTSRALAWQINAMGPGFLSQLANQHAFTLVHISTDYVFDGTKQPHTEDEAFSPLSVYGQSKAAGDIAVGITPKHYILRTTWLIGDGPNFVRTMMNFAIKNTAPVVVNDQIGRLTFTSTLVAAIDHLLSKQAPFGTYNVTDDGQPVSWAEIARAIFQEMDRDDLSVSETTTKEYSASKTPLAPRPLRSEMDLSKLKSTGFVIRDWREELHAYIKTEQPSKND